MRRTCLGYTTFKVRYKKCCHLLKNIFNGVNVFVKFSKYNPGKLYFNE